VSTAFPQNVQPLKPSETAYNLRVFFKAIQTGDKRNIPTGIMPSVRGTNAVLLDPA
jgi:hypothetical protein